MTDWNTGSDDVTRCVYVKEQSQLVTIRIRGTRYRITGGHSKPPQPNDTTIEIVTTHSQLLKIYEEYGIYSTTGIDVVLGVFKSALEFLMGPFRRIQPWTAEGEIEHPPA